MKKKMKMPTNPMIGGSVKYTGRAAVGATGGLAKYMGSTLKHGLDWNKRRR
jgi:hypothetical protein